MGTVRRYEITKHEGPEGTPALTAQEQARREAERVFGKGASVVHMGSSAIGLNLNMTPGARAEFLSSLDPALKSVAERHGIEHDSPSGD